MTKSSRPILLIGNFPSRLLDDLTGHDWKVIYFPELPEVSRMASLQDVKVGLVCIDAPSNKLEEFFICTKHLSIRWIFILSGHALQQGESKRLISHFCFDFQLEPVASHILLPIIGHAHGMSVLCAASPESKEPFVMLGEHPKFVRFIQDVMRVASVDINVMVHGETGTGKELAAQLIHAYSVRSRQKFFSVNCGSIAKSIIQSELFGHEKGAFTGADAKRTGYVESAHGGTLFLDEVGDMPAEVQVSMLRFLQEGTIVRVGGNKHIDVNARVITATHVDLKKAIEKGLFREDLYYRLRVCELYIPPLRERMSDIPILADFFINKHVSKLNIPLKRISDRTMAVMYNYSWPGNVRELENRLCQGLVMAQGDLILPEDMGLGGMGRIEVGQALKEVKAESEKQIVVEALRQCQGRCGDAANHIGVSRATFYRLLQKYGLSETGGRRFSGAK